MAPTYIRAFYAAVFGVAMWFALLLCVFLEANPVSAPAREFALELYAFAAFAAAIGFALVGCQSVIRTLCAVPIAVVLSLLIPTGLGVWLSQTFHSVTTNMVVIAILFATAGAIAAWLVARVFRVRAGHV